MAETGQENAASNEEESCVEMSNNNAIEGGTGANRKSNEVQSVDNPLKEENLAETDQGDASSHGDKSSVEISNNSPIKRGRGRPPGRKKLNQVSGISTGESKPPRRGRGRPKLQKATELKGSGDHLVGKSVKTEEPINQSSPWDNADAKDLPNGASDAPKAKRGRPKGSMNRKYGSSATRRNPRRSSNKTPDLETEESSEEGEHAEKPPRGRGRPKKIKRETGSPPPVKKRLGRPKGSLNKKRGQRGRPRKYPEELKKPRVWKPLGRPRKYPRVDPAEGPEPAPPRSRGRPHKSQSKKGAHLRKSLPSPSDPNVAPQRERGRPPKSDAVPKRKRGRPKGSGNTSKAGRGTPTQCADGNHSTAESDSPLVALKCEAEEVEIKEETPINQDADSEVSNQA